MNWREIFIPTDNFDKTFNKDNEIGYTLIADVEYPEFLHKKISFLTEKMVIKVSKLICTFEKK